MNKTKIEWCDYTINPVKGLCPMACSYCYARRMYKRFKWNPEIEFEPISKLPKNPSRIFVGSTMELFGVWIDAYWLNSIFKTVRDNPQHIFIFLTKLPQNLLPWTPFPQNCWVGATATNKAQYRDAVIGLNSINAKIKFISFEPLLEHIPVASFYSLRGINWIICGQQTPISKATEPKIEWITEIVKAADKMEIPVFLKNNLEGLLPQMKLRQEFPEV